jgi:hypothetical protein
MPTPLAGEEFQYYASRCQEKTLLGHSHIGYQTTLGTESVCFEFPSLVINAPQKERLFCGADLYAIAWRDGSPSVSINLCGAVAQTSSSCCCSIDLYGCYDAPSLNRLTHQRRVTSRLGPGIDELIERIGHKRETRPDRIQPPLVQLGLKLLPGHRFELHLERCLIRPIESPRPK